MVCNYCGEEIGSTNRAAHQRTVVCRDKTQAKAFSEAGYVAWPEYGHDGFIARVFKELQDSVGPNQEQLVKKQSRAQYYSSVVWIIRWMYEVVRAIHCAYTESHSSLNERVTEDKKLIELREAYEIAKEAYERSKDAYEKRRELLQARADERTKTVLENNMVVLLRVAQTGKVTPKAQALINRYPPDSDQKGT